MNNSKVLISIVEWEIIWRKWFGGDDRAHPTFLSRIFLSVEKSVELPSAESARPEICLPYSDPSLQIGLLVVNARRGLMRRAWLLRFF